MTNLRFPLFYVAVLAAISCNQNKTETQSTSIKTAAQQFLDHYNQEYQKLYTIAQDADWKSQTHIVEGDSANAMNLKAANGALAIFTGSEYNINACKKYLAAKDSMNESQTMQLEAILFLAGDKPAIVTDIVKERIAAEAAQTEKLYGYKFKIKEKEVDPNHIDSILKSDLNLDERLAAWIASKEIGKELKPGLIKLRDLRNKTVQSLGFSDFFSYMVS